jgi:hypothetical protein
VESPIAEHPLVRAFWKQSGRRVAEIDSLTEDAFEYTIRLEEDTIELREDRVSYYDSSVAKSITFRGRWTLLRGEPGKVVLGLSGAEEGRLSVEKALVLTEKDINYGDLAWARKYHL